MYKASIKTLIIIALSFMSMAAIAKENVGEGKTGGASGSYKDGAADCDAAESQFDLDINNVRTKLLSGGDLWWNLSDAKYEIPKIDPPGSAPSVHSLFAGAVWISGIDEGGNLKIAAQTYRQSGDDFWPGPIGDDGTIDNATCDLWDRHFNVYGSEIDDALTAVEEAGGVANPNAIPDNVKNWPAIGNPYLAAEGIVVTEQLAPFFDADGNTVYDPIYGDYPVIDANPDDGEYTYADQMVFWVYNDVGNIHTETQGQAIGLQVNALAFAFQTSDEINDMTFYRYTLTNKSNSSLTQTYMGQWVDPDLGCFNDDYVGCDTTRSLGIVYNGDAFDEDCQSLGYGASIPMLGIDYFEGPIDTNGVELGMSSFVYYNNDFTVTGNPQTAAHFRNYQISLWKDGNPIEFGGDGRDEGTFPFDYMFPAQPDDAAAGAWSECSESNPPADRRFLQNSGPFTLLSGAVNNITIGVVWVRPPAGTYPCPSFDALYVADDKAQALFDNNFKLLDGPDAPTLQIREFDEELIISIVNEPTSNNYAESYDQVDPLISVLPGTYEDSSYTFQGYIVYQLESPTVSASELDDRTKARPVAQFDVKDNVIKLVNFEYDQITEADVPVLKVDGNNNGIQHTIRITTDQFADGDPQLVNHKQYYYTAIAYAYNGYLEYNPADPNLGGQKFPFLQGRRNFQVYSAIPHIVDPRNMGTVLNSEYGDGVKVKRIEGEGNGGFELQMTQETIDQLLAEPDYSLDILEYEAGLGPINVKVVDPLNVKEAFFKMEFLGGTEANGRITDSSGWKLSIYDVEGGSLLHEVFSQRDFTRSNEQLIVADDGTSYGISITTGQPTPIYPAGDDESVPGADDVFDYITSSLTFPDPENPWLNWAIDESDGSVSFSNWIRSGTQDYGQGSDSPADFPLIAFNDHFEYNVVTEETYWYDALEAYEEIIGGGFAPYCLAANYADNDNDVFPYAYGPAFKWRSYNAVDYPRYTLDDMYSVKLVITPNKDLWTRCVVFEAGEAENLNAGDQFWPSPNGNTHKGQLRAHPSLDKDGNEMFGSVADTGRSWFPGYAINLETGERLNMAFAENSGLPDQNGNDMVWNPTSATLSPTGEVLMGGSHFVYIMRSKYDEGEQHKAVLWKNYNEFISPALSKLLPIPMRTFYTDIMYCGIPLLAPGAELLPMADGLVPETMEMVINVERPYAQYFTSESADDSLNVYTFNTYGLAPAEGVDSTATSALDLINVVPNPYYAYSSYETSQLDNRIKITNLPNQCTVTIFSVDGKLIRQFSRDIGPNVEIADGKSTEEVNLDNSIEWDLKNSKNIPIASGLYYIHVEAPGIGEATIKWFGALRPTDFDSF